MKRKKSVSDGHLMKKWRLAVLSEFNYACPRCGNSNVNELECHHVVKRARKVLRWDYKNGIPGCKYDCHLFYHTKKGERFIENHVDYDYLLENENKLYKTHLMENSLTDNEFRSLRLNELKEITEKNNKELL